MAFKNCISFIKKSVVNELGNETSVRIITVSYTHLRAQETVLDIVCRILLEKKQRSLIVTEHLQYIIPISAHHRESES